jgi:hypothetical protein
MHPAQQMSLNLTEVIFFVSNRDEYSQTFNFFSLQQKSLFAVRRAPPRLVCCLLVLLVFTLFLYMLFARSHSCVLFLLLICWSIITFFLKFAQLN